MLSQMTYETNCSTDRKYKLLLSYLVAILRHCFSLFEVDPVIWTGPMWD